MRLTELESLDRERRGIDRRIRQAKFPVLKTLDSFYFLAMPSGNKPLVLVLARCKFLARRKDVVLLGNSGMGETHIALARGGRLPSRPPRALHRFVPLSKTSAELIFEMLSQRYECGSTMLTSTVPFVEWTEVLVSDRLTTMSTPSK